MVINTINLMEYAWSNFILYDNLFITSTNTVGSTTVCVMDISISRSNDSKNGHFVDYTLICKEVSE